MSEDAEYMCLFIVAIVVFILGCLTGNSYTREHLIKDLCTQQEYNFCQKVVTYKLKEQ